jgi:hypothetical protein
VLHTLDIDLQFFFTDSTDVVEVQELPKVTPDNSVQKINDEKDDNLGSLKLSLDALMENDGEHDLSKLLSMNRIIKQNIQNLSGKHQGNYFVVNDCFSNNK